MHSYGRKTFGRSSERGVALLMVITVLVTMVIIAVAFAPQMDRGRARTEANAARTRADWEADILAGMVRQFLIATHPKHENDMRGKGEAGPYATPDWDTLEEITPGDGFRAKIVDQIRQAWTNDKRLSDRLRRLEARGLSPLNDDRGSIWSVNVKDANACINVNGCSPYLVGAMFGSALLSEEVDTGAGDISVEHVVQSQIPGVPGFNPDGGYIRIGREVIKYERFDGDGFRNCTRGVLQNVPLADNGGATVHLKGTPVIDYTAYKLATHIIAKEPGQLTRFRSLADLTTIAGWGEGGELSPIRLSAVAKFLTVFSRRETAEGFLASQLVTNDLPSNAEDPTTPDVVWVRDQLNETGTTRFFNAGTIARITDGVNTVYQCIAQLGDAKGRQFDRQLELAGPAGGPPSVDGTSAIEFDGGKTTIAAMAPYPININTAPREVLYAVMANLRMRFAKGDDHVVDPKTAWKIAGLIVDNRKGKLQVDLTSRKRSGGPFRNAEDFGRFLEDLVRKSVIGRRQQEALYTNAINPHSATLNFGTAPWCYRTLDVYHIESRVAVNNRAGEQIADAGLFQVVEIGSDEVTAWTLDSQADFEARLAMGSGSKYTASYPYYVQLRNRRTRHMQPAPRPAKHLQSRIYPNTSFEAENDDVGDVRLEPVRMRLPGAVLADHFDGSVYTDGHYTGYSGAYTEKTKGVFRSEKQTYVQPFAMSFWWRPYSSANWTAFDCGMEKFMNRYAVFVTDGAEGQELVFRVCAGTREDRGAEVYVPFERLDYEEGNWYHIQISCTGEDPSTMQLLVDGVDLSKRRGVSTLVAALSEDNTEVQVKSAEGFPRIGALQVGTEIIEYDITSGDSFEECVRGARGTAAQAWPAGTPVRMLGYSLPILQDIMQGGAGLTETLRKWSAGRVYGEEPDSQWADDLTVGEIALGGYAPDTTSITCKLEPLWGQSQDECYEAFGTRGIAVLGCRPIEFEDTGSAGPDEFPAPGGSVPPGARQPSNPSGGGGGSTPAGGGGSTPSTGGGTGGATAGIPEEPVGGWELVYYERSDDTFTITRYYEKSPWQEPAEPHWLITRIVSAQQEWPCFLVPISVQISGGGGTPGSDYLDPAVGEEEEILLRYGGDGWGRVAIGTDAGSQADPSGTQDQVEVIRYSSIERDLGAPDLLLVADRDLVGTIGHFRMDDTQTMDPNTPPVTTDPEPTPEPEPPEDPPTPEPPGEDPGDQPPSPGGGVPPGLREPFDPPDSGDSPDSGGGGETPGSIPGGGGETPDSGGGGETPDSGGGAGEDPNDGGEEPGTGDEGGGSGGGGPAEGDEGDNEEPDDGDTDDGGGGGEPVTPDEGDSDGGDDAPSAGGGVPPGLREPFDDPNSGGGEEPPPETEPVPDGSGGGSDEGGEEDGDDAEPLPAQDEDELENRTDEVGDFDFNVAGPETARRILNHRGVNGTWDWDHIGPGGPSDPNGRAVPCFRVFEGHGGLGRAAGRNDQITIVDGTGEDAVRYTGTVRWGENAVGGYWVSLTDFIDARVAAPEDGADEHRLDLRGRPRILKFPCGELPDEMSDEMEFGRSTISNSDVVTAFLDELFVWRHAMGPVGIVVNSEGVTEQTEEIVLYPQAPAETLEDIAGYDKDCGVFLLDGEMIVYRGTRTEGDRALVLERCMRGMFGTKATLHGRGGYGRFITDVPVTYLEGDVKRDANTIPVAHTRRWPREGCARIVGPETVEVIHYTRISERDLVMPEALDSDESSRGRGLFRGRFGTDVMDHEQDSVVIFQPFRYWDRYTPRRTEDDQAFSGVHDHPETSYLELGTKYRDAFWHNVRWEENLDGALRGEDRRGRSRRGGGAETGFLDMIVLARFNPNVPWDTQYVTDMRKSASVTSSTGMTGRPSDQLYVFDDPEELNKLGFESNTAQFRIYYVYKPNAFVGVDMPRGSEAGSADDEEPLQNAWKKTPWLRSFTVSYTNRTRTVASSEAGPGR